MLDAFCSAGGCSRGYAKAGFTEIVGVDIKPQKNYLKAGVPGVKMHFIQADALKFIAAAGHLFDAIHASPPCQRYSITMNIHGQKRAAEHPDLVDPVREILDRIGKPWIIENVMGAPLRNPIMLCGTMFGLRVLRHRLFESNIMLMAKPHAKHPRGILTNSHRGYDRGESPYVCLAGHNFERREGEKAIGIDWMGSRKELAQAIPPAYTEFIGRQLIAVIENRKDSIKPG